MGAYIAAKNPDLVAFVGTGAAREMVEAARVMGFSEDKIEQFGDVNEALTVLGPVTCARRRSSRQGVKVCPA